MGVATALPAAAPAEDGPEDIPLVFGDVLGAEEPAAGGGVGQGIALPLTESWLSNW